MEKENISHEDKKCPQKSQHIKQRNGRRDNPKYIPETVLKQQEEQRLRNDILNIQH